MTDRPTEQSLIAANERFYRTFEALDFQAMAALWEDSGRVFCVHPGWQALRGARPVLESWKRIMEHTGEIRFTLTGVTAHIAGDIGIVTCHEHIYNRIGDERQSSGAVSTNLFAFDAATGRWRIFHHHAAPAAVPEEEPEGGPLLV